MEDTSPTKWRLAHTSRFFEQFILREHAPGDRSPDDRFAFLFNSYCVQAGPRHARSRRGLITRPAVDEVMAFRAHVDAAIIELLADPSPEIAGFTVLGCHHEMQHQELLVTDLLHALSFNGGVRRACPSAAPRGAARTASRSSRRWFAESGPSQATSASSLRREAVRDCWARCRTSSDARS